MANIDKRGKLDENPFDYFISKDMKLHISFKGKNIMILKDAKAEAAISKIQQPSDFDVQLILAKLTGNFKHGNER